VSIKPRHEVLERVDLDVPAGANLMQKGWIIERARADFGAWHAGLAMEMFGRV
jgi:hypothetical protein